MDQPFFLNTSKESKSLGVKSLCIEKDSLAGSSINASDSALTVHTLTDSPPIATDKCKLSLNSVNCKYVNSKLRLPAVREQCAD